MSEDANNPTYHRRAEGPWSDLALHSIGWKAFQDLCSQVCEEVLGRPVEIFREAQDGGQDAVFLLRDRSREHTPAVGTVQCKHSCDGTRSLKPSDLTAEVETIKALVAASQADTYVLMTSMSLDGPTASTIRTRLREFGVRKPHILGKQYLVRSIRSSPRLRALVPQVYGLGDLTAILDERTIQQSRALLDDWVPRLRAYVPTSPHRRAVKVLDEHGIVLLLGNPSSGKSAIGAILSMLAADDPNHTVLTLTSPRDFERGWNPNDPGRFFWIDDAFGSNVVREEFVQDWTSTFRKVQAAISHGNRFLLTSRRHVYVAAAARLGQRNLPVLHDGRAVVHVGDLSSDEKRQILYNHIAFGGQSLSWKRSVKPYLETASQVSNFLPGIAERLGNPMFTKSLPLRRQAIVQFMEDPKPHLVDTINALDEPLRAGLVLVYVCQGRFDEHTHDSAASRIASETSGVSVQRILDCLPDMRGSFLKVSDQPGERVWGFAHPTIADALTDILKERPHMIAAFVRGAPIHTILSSCVCESTSHAVDSLRIPIDLNPVLIRRLVQAPDEVAVNSSLFAFLENSATDEVLRSVATEDPRIFLRRAHAWSHTTRAPRFRTIARAARLGCLDSAVRGEVAIQLEEIVESELDISLIENEELLGLIQPLRLVALGMKLQAEWLPDAPERISKAGQDIDLNYESESAFDKFSVGLDVLAALPDLSHNTVNLVDDAIRSVEQALEDARERTETHTPDPDDWKTMSASASQAVPEVRQGSSTRSIFDDVDH